MLTDERIDQVAGVIKSKTPDNIDKIVDQAAEIGRLQHALNVLTDRLGAAERRVYELENRGRYAGVAP